MMLKYSGPEDCYRELVEDSDDNWLYGLVAFAVVEEQRIEWMRHVSDQHGAPPTPEEIRKWYEQQPQGVLLRAKGIAENALEAYSSEVVDTFVEEKTRELEEGIIVNEIRESRRFWPQFGVNLAGGFASALIFAGFLIVLAFLVFNDKSPVDLGKELSTSMEVTERGEQED